MRISDWSSDVCSSDLLCRKRRRRAQHWTEGNRVNISPAMTIPDPIHVIGGGLAGSEAAWQIARAGVPVILHEMRPIQKTDAHQTDGLAEHVCPNRDRKSVVKGKSVSVSVKSVGRRSIKKKKQI